MKRARIDDVWEAIQDLPMNQQKNVMNIAKNHGVTTRFVELVNNPELRQHNMDDWLQKYISELNSEE